MSQTRSLSLIAGAAAILGAAGTVVAEDAWSDTSTSTDEVRAMVAEMMADAETRSSLLQAGGGGHDGNNFYLSGGDFTLNIEGQIQFRYYLNFRDDNGGQDDFESGFQTRRTKLGFSGDVHQFFYKVVGAFDRNGGAFTLEDAYVGMELDNGSKVRWGQFKLPFMREELVSSKYQLAVDRTLVNESFNQDRSQGIEWSWHNDDFSVAAAFSDGFNSDNSEFASAAEADYALTGRVQWKWAGTWSQFKDFTSMPGSTDEIAGMLGGAIHWEGSDTDSPRGEGDLFSWTVDLSIEGDGWNFFAAGVGRHGEDFYSGVAASNTDDYGIVVQGGLFIPETNWEFFARYDVIFADDGRPGNDDFSTITVGLNNYIHGHAAKFTLDMEWYIDEGANSDFAVTNTGIGYLSDNDDGELVFRAQFQLLF